jgi:hypothetical protein
MKKYVPRVEYDRDEESRMGYASLGIVLGRTSLNEAAYVLLSGPSLHNPEITLHHEQTHKHLFALSTVGNIQQLLAHAITIEGIDHNMRHALNGIIEVSVDGVRWLHEGCATYVELKCGQIYKLAGWEQVRGGLPKYYLDALRPFEDVIERLPIYEDSKIVLAETIARFALSPDIYKDFYDPKSIHVVDTTVFKRCLDRATKMFNLLSDHHNGKKFANLYNAFVEKTYTEIHGFPWTTDLHLRAKKVKPANIEKFALEELQWLYQYILSHLPSMRMVNPRDVLEIQPLSTRWAEYLKERGINTNARLSFSVKTQDQIDSAVNVKAPGLSHPRMISAPSLDSLSKVLRESDTRTFAQVYIHHKVKPFILNPNLGRQVRQGEAYVRFSRATVRSKPSELDWHDSAYYVILPSSDLLVYLKSIDRPNLFLCFWEEDIRELCVKCNGKLQFINFVVGLVFPTDLESLKKLMQHWSPYIEGCLAVEMPDMGNHFIVFSCIDIGIQLIAPVSRRVTYHFHDWALASGYGGLRKWHSHKLRTSLAGIDGATVFQGIAFFGF